ncbi:right-handed parallel beta-helix repeat-containing protein [Marinimicrobium sp. LS-A18]|uniref:right-handed parallel beta-helix repeat-containing protein n=1 Tax=Marinimicrobium sp. LS-A18 TaxID=1381596 RepID=UPI0009DBBA81|nr:right-handed parallel beta-helix repeat-containing protein [Marinimicrobium sp. LS-A18]
MSDIQSQLHSKNRFFHPVFVIAWLCLAPTAWSSTLLVDSASEIQNALQNASPGDEIVIAPGTYEGNTSTSGYSGAHFFADASGTASSRIVVRSEDPDNPAVLEGSSLSSKIVLHIKGDYWDFKNLAVTHAQKGIILDGANYNLLESVEVFDTRDEGVHFRDASSNNVIQNSYIHDTGAPGREGYGEGIYVGTASSQWDKYDENCHDNVIRSNRIGPGVGGEHIDIKEGTLRTIVEYNTFNGTGISGEHYADSFIDVKGNDAIIRYNTGYRNGNSEINDAFDVFSIVSGWGINNQFFQNIVDLDGTSGYVVNVNSGSAQVAENYRDDAGTNLYSGNYSSYTIPDLYLKPKSAQSYCVTPQNGDFSQNNTMVIYQCGASDDFKWHLVNAKDGHVKITNAGNPTKNIKVYQGILQNNEDAVIYEDQDYHSQIWEPVYVDAWQEHVAFRNRSDSSFYLKVYNGVFSNDQKLVIYEWNDWGSQKFIMDEY